MRWKLLVVGCLFFPLLGLAAGQTHEYRLKNGLTLIVKEDHRAPVVFSSVWYRVGGSYEQNGITGISHMLEHMMFQGTKRHGPMDLVTLVNRHGGQQNAMTGSDYTMYYQMFSADQLQVSFDLESDRMRHLILQQSLYNKEHQVVMEERRMRVDDSPQGKTYERFLAAAYVNSPYHHPVVGWMGDIKQLTLADMKQWYHTWYAPNNAVVVVVGDVQPEQVLALAKHYFSPLASGKIPVLKTRKEVRSLGYRQVVVRAPAKLPWLIMGYNVPVFSTAKDKKEVYALAIIARVLATGNSARLVKDLVRGQQIAADVDADYSLFTLHDGLFTLDAVPAKGQSIKGLKRALLAHIKKLQTTLVSEQELARVRAQIRAAKVYQKDSLYYQALEIGVTAMVGASWRDAEAFLKNIAQVTPEDIRAVAQRYFQRRNLTVGILHPEAIKSKQPLTKQPH